MHLDWDLVDSLEDLQLDLIGEVSKVLGLEGDVDGVLSVGKELTSRWCGPELGDLGEVEVQWEVVTLVPDRQGHVFPLIGGTGSKVEELAVDLDLRVLGPGHHLDLQVGVLDANLFVLIKFDDGQGGVVSRLDCELALVHDSGAGPVEGLTGL